MLVTIPMATLVITHDFPPGQRQLSASIDATILLVALAGGLMLVVGWVTRVGIELAEENEGFV